MEGTMKKYEYLPVEEGTIIGPSMAVQQTVHILDLASAISTDEKNVSNMLKVARRWLELGASLESILPEVDEDDEEKVNKDGKKPYGFVQGQKAIIEQAGENDGKSTVED